MSKALQNIARDVLGLPRTERLGLAQLLLNLADERETENVDLLWDEEIRSRLKAYDEERITALPFEEIRREMANRFSR